MLNGHGWFSCYQRRVHQDSECFVCGVKDTAEHCYLECVKWRQARETLSSQVGRRLVLLLSKNACWNVKKIVRKCRNGKVSHDN